MEALGLEGALTADLSLLSERLAQVLLGSCLCSSEVLISKFIPHFLSPKNMAQI